MNSDENEPDRTAPVLEYGKEQPAVEKLVKRYQVHRRVNALPKANIVAVLLVIPCFLVTGAIIFAVRGDLRWWGTVPCILLVLMIAEAAVQWLAPASWKKI
jgi:hypothetical protein